MCESGGVRNGHLGMPSSGGGILALFESEGGPGGQGAWLVPSTPAPTPSYHAQARLSVSERWACGFLCLEGGRVPVGSGAGGHRAEVGGSLFSLSLVVSVL